MPRIHTVRTKNDFNQDVISLVLSQDSVSAGPDGDPWCGVSLSAEQARSLAQRLCNIAIEIENQEKEGYRTSPRSLIHLSSVAVVHDGSEQGHRAYQAGLDFAGRTLSKLDFIGIFGIDSETGQPSDKREYYEWQKGWLSRLVDMYWEEAGTVGVNFSSQLFPASEPCVLFDTLYRTQCDLIVIPKDLVRFGNHRERLMPSVVNRLNANVLVCP
jgi:hypothetical protein